jgi:hypothetical protein
MSLRKNKQTNNNQQKRELFLRRRKILKWIAGAYTVSYILPMLIVVYTHPFWDTSREENTGDILITVLQFFWTVCIFKLIGDRFFNIIIHERIYTFFGGIKTHNFKLAHIFLWFTFISTMYYSVLTTDKSLGILIKVIPGVGGMNITPDNAKIFILSGILSLFLSIAYIFSYRKWMNENQELLHDYTLEMTMLFREKGYLKENKNS